MWEEGPEVSVPEMKGRELASQKIFQDAFFKILFKINLRTNYFNYFYILYIYWQIKQDPIMKLHKQ